MKKFTLSFACIIFFFIGAPLGAIIRKGGLGMPLVISVFLFIFYYIIDNTGYKMARNGSLEVWQGMWLSSAVLLPLGIFFTYKAVNDSAVFNIDAYTIFFRKLLGRNEVRNVQMKEVIIDEVENAQALMLLSSLKEHATQFLNQYKSRQNYLSYWLNGFDRTKLHSLSKEVETVVEYLSNSRDKMVINRLMDLPIMRSLWLYKPSSYKWIGITCVILFPIGLPIYLLGISSQKHLLNEIKSILKTCDDLEKSINNNNP